MQDLTPILEVYAVKTLAIRIPDVLEARLTALARKRGISRSKLVEEALKEYCSCDAENSPGSFLELAGDLAGCLEGPPDLSVNEAYLEGYGKEA